MKRFWILPAILTTAFMFSQWASAFVLPTETAPPSTCSKDALRCWFMIYAVNDAPERIAYLADAYTIQVSPNVKRLLLAEARENQATDQPEYLAYTVEFDCKKPQMRQLEAYRAWRDNRMEHDAKPYDWIKVPSGWHQRAWAFACDPAAVHDPVAHQILHLVDVYRPADAVAFVRQFLWKNMQKPPLADEVDR